MKIKKYNSDLIVKFLKKIGIKYIAYNPGATFRGIHDSLINCKDEGRPKLLLCCHEEIAIAIAHGYAKASGKYMAVLIHSNVGLQSASMAIFNAWCDRVPMLLIGGIGPMDSAKRRPWIDWIHTSNNHASIINDYVKWHDQPYSIQGVTESLFRANQLTNTVPKAPVYVGIDSCLQEEEIDFKAYDEIVVETDADKFQTPISPAMANNISEEIIDKLKKARLPVMLLGYSGKDSRTVKKAVMLAEIFQMPVIDLANRYNFPSTNELCLTELKEELLATTDCLLALDIEDLEGTLSSMDESGEYRRVIQNSADIFHISLSHYLVSKWSADYQKLSATTKTISCDSVNALEQLIKMANLKLKKPIVRKEIKKYQDKKLAMRLQWLSEVKTLQRQNPLHISVVISKMWEIIQKEGWVLTNIGSIAIKQELQKFWNFDQDGCYLGFSGGGGLGYGIGASAGAALFYKGSGRVCINLQADGDFLFTPSALWTIANQKIPLLTIIMNNQSYNNTKEHTYKIAKNRGHFNKKMFTGSDINDPVVDFPDLARSFGLKAYNTIETVFDLKEKLKLALEDVKSGNPVVLDIRIQ